MKLVHLKNRLCLNKEVATGCTHTPNWDQNQSNKAQLKLCFKNI